MFDEAFQRYFTAKNVIFTVILILFIIFVSKIQDIAIMFFASFVISCSLEPLVTKFSVKYGRQKASTIVLTCFVILVCAFFVPLIALAGHEIKNFAVSFPQYLLGIKDFIKTNPYLANTDFSNIDFGGVISSASDVTSNIVNETINIGKNIGSAFVYLVVSIIIMYYFLADKETIEKTFLRLFPSEMRGRADEIMNSISQKVGGYVIAQITTMASVGIIVAIGLALLKIDYAVLLGVITSVLDIVPVVGPAIALIICLIAAYKAGPIIMLLVLLVFGAAQLCENNFVRPYVFGKFLDLHPLIIYLFLFIAAKYMGVIGVIFAPAIAATVVVLIEELYMKNLD